MAGADVTVYTTEPCGFCAQAKALLTARGVEFEEVNLAKDAEGRAELVATTGQMTFPQILVGGRAIGGFRELLEADRDGKLPRPAPGRLTQQTGAPDPAHGPAPGVLRRASARVGAVSADAAGSARTRTCPARRRAAW